MSRYSFKRLSAFLSQSSLNVFRSSAPASEQKLVELVWASTSPDLAGHTKILAQKNGRILIQAASSAWAHKAFHQQRQIEKSLLAAGITVSSIQVRVSQSANLLNVDSADLTKNPNQRSNYNRGRARAKAKPLSKSSARNINSLAETLTDGDLKESLKRLSQHTNQE